MKSTFKVWKLSSLVCAGLLVLSLPAIGSLALVSSAAAQTLSPEPLSAFPQSSLSIKTKAGRVLNFKIWTADSPRREEQGLMFVHHMDSHSGMLFTFPGNRMISMWMKNTYIPLDMVFTDSKGRIDYIERNARPLSTYIIGAPTAEYAVLELNAGACDRFGIRVGDTLRHSTVSK